ncbi:VCBS repeat-containing protein [Mesobacterium sp. TK19101]|uniref:VCBS repeat-containing protein n=1 Tax=Mesobacterium hydrothermale TaxID=3111907 RepID=A0ABU6HJK9_9RHOB|nr:VCBS repeat-containing protein [Mesobacterium sp. TK19101]MEC3862650.1 VCBS repeat-containing protein [Mesobacterium sp. TK19101]
MDNYVNTARFYGFDLNSWVSPSTFAITDFDRDGQWELTYTLFDRDGLGATAHPIRILEFRDASPPEGVGWIFEPDGSLVDITAEIFANDPNGIPEISFGRHMVIKDVNGDGYDDLIVANHGFDRDPFPGGPNIVAVSDGQGGLVDMAAQFETEPGFTHSVAVGDFNGDGRTDFFFGNLNVDNAYFGTLDGATAVRNSLPLVPDANRYTRSFASDITGDGLDELFLGGGCQRARPDGAVDRDRLVGNRPAHHRVAHHP